jgi:hypothetical protein
MARKTRGKRQLLTSAAVGVGLVGIPAQAAVWIDDGKIYLREGGQVTEVPTTPALLDALRATGGNAKLSSDPKLIMSGGGGAAFSFFGRQNKTPEAPPSSANPITTTPSSQPQAQPQNPNKSKEQESNDVKK